MVELHEPMTLATDVLLGAVAAVFAYRLRPACHWALAFAATAPAAFAGGIYHGFAPYLTPLAAAALWKATVYSVGLASCFLLLGAAHSLVESIAVRRALSYATIAGFTAYAVWMVRHDDFLYVIIGYGSAMLILGLLALRAWKTAGGRWIAASVGTSVLAALVQQSGIALHRHFNHNDLYHLVQIAALWMLYRGAATFTTTSTTPATTRPT